MRLTTHHAACAAMLEARTGTRGAAERLGRHLLAAGLDAFALGPLLQGVNERIDACDYRFAEALLARRGETVDGLGLPPDDRARVEQWVAGAQLALYPGGRVDEADALAANAASVATAAGWPRIACVALWIRGRCARSRGDPVAALLHLRRASVLAADPRTAGDCHFETGHVFLQCGDLAAAEASFSAALADHGASGSAPGRAWAWEGLARVAQQRGEPEASATYFEHARRIFEACGNRRGVANSLNSRGDVERARGNLAEAERLYRAARDAFEALGSWAARIAELNLGGILLERGDWAGARVTVEACLGPFAALERRQQLAAAHVYLMCAAAGEADWPRWDHHHGEGRSLLLRTGYVEADVARVAERAAILAGEAGEWRRREDAIALARDQWEALGRVEELARLG
jgi:tetratricopeptide (TPR) repeat protein